LIGSPAAAVVDGAAVVPVVAGGAVVADVVGVAVVVVADVHAAATMAITDRNARDFAFGRKFIISLPPLCHAIAHRARLSGRR
jgi:hypothetical protein